MTDDPRRIALVGLELAGLLDPGETEWLVRVSALRSFPRGTVLWRAGSESRGLHVVLAGSVRIVRERRGRQHLVHVSRPGDTMGEVSLVAGVGYPATAIAASDTECLVVPPADARRLIETNAGIANLFLARLARRVEMLVARLEQQTLGSVRTRLAASLLGMATGSDSTVVLPRPRAQWAEDLGTVREVLARELAALESAGLVERVDATRARLLDEAGLEALALGEPTASAMGA